VVKLLDEMQVRATFFLQGRWVEAYPDTARRIVDAGHLVGNHSFYHARLSLLSDEGLRVDVAEAERAIREATGVDPRPWFRCPFGDGSDDERVLSALASAGYRNAHWGVEPQEWRPERTASLVIGLAVDGAVAAGDGAVVLFHAWPEPVVEALPAVVAGLRDRGVTFVTVDEVPEPSGSQRRPAITPPSPSRPGTIGRRVRMRDRKE